MGQVAMSQITTELLFERSCILFSLVLIPSLLGRKE
jgi:hypothetical protein